MLHVMISALFGLAIVAALIVASRSGLRGLRQLFAVMAELDAIDRLHDGRSQTDLSCQVRRSAVRPHRSVAACA